MNEFELLCKAVIIALSIFFIHRTTDAGMINAWLPRLCYRLPVWIKKPLYMCPICMTSIWGTALWFQPIDFITYLFACGGVLCVLAAFIPDDELRGIDEYTGI